VIAGTPLGWLCIWALNLTLPHEGKLGLANVGRANIRWLVSLFRDVAETRGDVEEWQKTKNTGCRGTVDTEVSKYWPIRYRRVESAERGDGWEMPKTLKLRGDACAEAGELRRRFRQIG